PPTSTSTGYGIYESAFPPIGETGATICSRERQFSRIKSINLGTRPSSTPIKKVVFPERKNPPVLASLVARKSFFVKALDNRLLSWSCTTATTSFISTHSFLFVFLLYNYNPNN